jgi:SWI/SNF-related matrix-associated actin-dependent regulator of chromatin subfamily A3
VFRLNITAASRIHIVEPQWNPAVESQAIGRSARLGQQNHVKIVRYVMKNTVEEVSNHHKPKYGWNEVDPFIKYIKSRQFRKLQLAGIGWSSGKEQEEQKLRALLVRRPCSC